MKKIFDCPCGEKIEGRTIEEVLERDLNHVEASGHPFPDIEQLEQIQASIRTAS